VLSDRAVRYVASVASCGSIRAAARDLGVAPSAVQRTLAAVERQLGTDLFERTARGVTPTDAGWAVAAHAQERRDLDSVLASTLAGLNSLHRGHLSIATGESYVRELWRTTLSPFLDEHPAIQVRLHTAGSGEIVDLLVSDEVDVAIALHPRPDPAATVVASTAQPLRVVCRPDHPFACRAAVHPQELEGCHVAMLPPAFGLRTLHDELMRTHGVQVIPRLEAESQAAVLEAVLTGHALALLPPVTVRQHVKEGRLVAVPLDDPQTAAVKARLLVRTGRRLTSATRALVAACREGMFTER
jgi:DNA-binding transcriptional LysR family regulator